MIFRDEGQGNCDPTPPVSVLEWALVTAAIPTFDVPGQLLLMALIATLTAFLIGRFQRTS